MPIIKYVTDDMFEFESHIDYMVNPCNTCGVGGKGLSLEFRKRAPNAFDAYVKACKDKSLQMGTVQVIDEGETPWGIINVPTKRYWGDCSDLNDISRTLGALRTLLLQDRFKNASVGIPMLGTGNGKQDYADVMPLMQQFLADLPNPIILSMAPAKTDFVPNYLTIFGPPDVNRMEDYRSMVEEKIMAIFEKWGVSWSDFTGVISMGSDGIESYLTGKEWGKDYEESWVFKQSGIAPLVCLPNPIKRRTGSSIFLGKQLIEVSQNVIFIKPHGRNNNRAITLQLWLVKERLRRLENGRPKIRTAIIGDASKELVIEQNVRVR